MAKKVRRLTCYRANSATPSIVIDDCSVAFDCTIHGQITSVTCICNFPIFEYLDGNLNGVHSISTVVQERHRRFRGTENVLVDLS